MFRWRFFRGNRGYKLKTIDEIYNSLKQSFESESGLTLNDGGDMALRFYALAAELVSLWAQCDYVNRQSFPQTASGEYLDKHAQMRGLVRGGATKAQGSIKFIIETVRSRDVFIPKGTRCMTADLTEFQTTEHAFIDAGSLYCSVPAQAVYAGKKGNAAAGEVNIMQNAPTGVSIVTNPLPFSGGEDKESDKELRERVLKSYESIPNGGNSAYYEMLALNVPGVAAVNVLPRERGRGTVDIIIASDSGMPSNELVAAVSAAVDARREICVDVDVAAPTAVTVNVTAEITVASGYTPAAVLRNVENAISAYFSGKRLGKNILRAELGNAVYSVAGVENFSLSAPAADTAISKSELPVVGTLTVSEASS